MIAMSRALRIWRQGRLRDQRGFALMFVLGVIALTSLTIVALLGMLFVSLKVTETQAANAREQLALDGAVDAATNQLRYLPGAVFSDPCDVETPFERVEEMAFDDGSGGELVVDVECTDGEVGGATSTGDAVRLVGFGGYDGSFDWRSGDWTVPWTNAAGGVPDLADEPNLVHLGREPLKFDSGVTVRNGAAVVRDANQTPAVLAAGQYLQGGMGPMAAPGATGAAACGLLAGVGGLTEAGRISDLDGVPECDSASAREVDRSPTDAQAGFAFDGEFSGGVAPLDPAVNTSRCVGNGTPNENVVEFFPGRYDQSMVDKLNRLLSAKPNTTFEGCLTTTFWFHPGVYYFDAELLDFDNQSSAYVMGTPLCWDPSAPVPSTVSDARLVRGVRNPNNATMPSVIADPRCWDGSSFKSPFLNPEATLCDPEESGATFILSPRTRISHTAGNLAMCPAHDDEGRPLPALYQETSVDNAVEVTLPAAAQGTRTYRACNRDWSQFNFQWVNLGQGNRCAHELAYRVGVEAQPGNTIERAELLLTGFQVGSWGQDGGEGGGPHSLVEGRQTRIEVRNASNLRICSTGWLDGMPTGISGAPMTASFDLKDPSDVGPLPSGVASRCRDALTQTSQFAPGTELVVFHRLVWFIRNLEEVTLVNLFAPNLAQQYVTSDAGMVLNGTPMVLEDDPAGVGSPLNAAQKLESPATFGTTSASVPNPAGPIAGFDDVQNVMSADGALAVPQMPCAEIMCPVTSAATPSTPFVHDLGLRRMTVPVDALFETNNIDPNVETLRLNVGFDPSGPMSDLTLAQFNEFDGPLGDLAGAILDLVDEALDPLLGRSQWTWFLRDMELRAELRRASGETICRATKGPVASVQDISIDLMADGDCDGRVQSYADLQGLDLHLSVAMPCVRTPSAPTSCMRWGGAGTVLQVRPPSIDHVQLLTTTDSWAGQRPRSQATVDFREPADVAGLNNLWRSQHHGASFNVLGKAWLPLHDLDLHWRGKVTPDRPLISGDLVLNGLGSRTYGTTATTEIVCCDESRPETRTVLFIASVDGTERLRVRVRYTDVRPVGGDPNDVVEDVGHKVEILDWQRCGNGGCGPPGG